MERPALRVTEGTQRRAGRWPKREGGAVQLDERSGVLPRCGWRAPAHGITEPDCGLVDVCRVE